MIHVADIKVFLVEDDKIDAMDIKETLESFNYEVPYVASNGKDAIEKIIKIMPDLILIDIGLEGAMNGIEVASQIKKLNIPLIFITTHVNELTLEKAMDTEPYGYLIKPYDETKLRLSIEHALHRKKIQDKGSQEISLTKAINRVLQESLTSTSAHGVAKICIEVAEELTSSSLGFIGEINPAGRFDTLAVSDPIWDTCIAPDTKIVKLLKNMKIRSYWGRTISTEKSVIVNDPTTDPDRLGEPEGHPEITSFLGVPLKQAGKTVGMIALANKQDGYNHDDVQAVETLSVAFLEALYRKKTEITLQKSEERFRAVAESAVDAIVTTDVNGTIRFFNQSLEKIFEYLPQELTGSSLTLLMPERYKNDYLEELERFKKSGKHRLVGRTVVTTGLKKDGTEFPFEMSLASWKSGTDIFFTSIIRDLTEKRQAENELKRSETRLKMGMDMAKLVYWEYDLEKDIFTFDDQFYSLYGTSAEKEGGYQMSSAEYTRRFIPPKEQALVTEEIGKLLKTDDPDYSSTIQHSVIRPDGKKMHMIVRIRIRKDENGRKIGTKGVNQDITELVKVEEALAETDQRLSDIIEFLPDATLVIDSMGRIISWNQAIEELTGVNSEEMIGKGNYEYAIPFYGMRRPILIDMIKNSNEEISKYYQGIKRKGKVLIGETSSTLKGDKRTLWGKAVPFYDCKGDFAGAIEAIRDITDMKESRRKLRRELEINKSLANIYTPLVSPQSTLTDVGMAILGEAGKLTGSPYGFVSIIEPASGDNIKQTVTMMSPDSDEPYKDEIMVKLQPNPDGSYNGIWGHVFNTRKSLFTNSPQKHPAYAGVPSDHLHLEKLLLVPVILGEELVGQITLANASKNYTNDDLKAIERVAVFYALAIQNKRAEQEIKQSLHDKEILLREIHHRVKNNMQIISSLLNLQICQADEEEAENVLKESQGRVKSMAMVHEKLYQSPSFTKIDFKDYTEKLVSDIFFSYGVSRDTIELELDIEDVQMNIDTAIPCGLIINELVTNCVKYAFPHKKGTLKIQLHSLPEHMELIIADNGVGLPDNLDFQNTDSLGLQLVDSLVNQIEGKITLDKNQGTKFTITFKELQYKNRI